jgi:HD-GYP domain-containing protein (c-di-GMP phosphodiesterase class II)
VLCYAFNIGGMVINTSLKIYIAIIISLSMSVFIYGVFSFEYTNITEVFFLPIAFLLLTILLNRELYDLSNSMETFIFLPIILPAIIYLDPLLVGLYVSLFFYTLLKWRKEKQIKILFNVFSVALVAMCLGILFHSLLNIHSLDITSTLFFLYLFLAGGLYTVLSNLLITLVLIFQKKVIDPKIINEFLTSLKTSTLTIFLGMINVIIFYYFGIIGIALILFIIYSIKPMINFHSILNQELSTFTTFVLHIIKLYDPITYAHSERVKTWTVMIAKEMKLSSKQIHELSQAASWHDIGKLEIPNEIINKDGKLTDEEYEIVKTHPEIGYNLVKDMHFFKDYLPVIRYHHERIDGKGYPLGLKGNEISLHARIMCVADAFDAMTSMRSYKQGMTMKEAVEEMRSCTGTQFDPKVVETFVQALVKKYGPEFQGWGRKVS